MNSFYIFVQGVAAENNSLLSSVINDPPSTADMIKIVIAGIVSIFVLLETLEIGKLKKEKWDLDLTASQNNKRISENNKEISENNKEISGKQLSIKNKEFDIQQKEYDYKAKTLAEIRAATDDISKTIAQNLINNPTWLDRFMDETGATYVGSIFGDRINHFFYEKQALAEKAIEELEIEMKANKDIKYCIFIDSGTTLYHLFHEICDRLKKENKEIWKKRVFIITNNLPGVQYFMKHCTEDDNEYSDASLNCLLLPGKPLAVYGAVTGEETTNFLKEDHIKPVIEEHLGAKKGEYEIISFITGNYMIRHDFKEEDPNKKDVYLPAARDAGHYKLKSEFAKLSDKIFIISPLTKFSFATCDQLNDVNGFTIDEDKDPKGAKNHPNKVRYKEIEVIGNKKRDKCIYIITTRQENDLFKKFATELEHELINSYGRSNVKIATKFNMEQCIPYGRSEDAYSLTEINREIPHEELREAYSKAKVGNKHFIWDKGWMDV
jgi:hypothetical protein